MKGRLETEIKREKKIEKILESMPIYVTDYYYHMRAKGLQSKTAEDYIKNVRRLLKFINEDVFLININDVNETDISKYIYNINRGITSSGEEIKRSVSNSKTIYYALKNFFDYMYRGGKINNNPMLCVDKPRGKDKVKRLKITALDEKEILKTVNNGSGSEKAINYQERWKERDRLIMLLFMYTGMRKTALTEINLEDINLNEKKIIIVDKREETHEYVINKELENGIIDWLIQRKKLLNGEKCDALFISNRRKRMSGQSIALIVDKYASSVIGQHISPHKLRAAYATMLYDKTKDIVFVQGALGHKNISTTRIYISEGDETKRKATNIISTLLND